MISSGYGSDTGYGQYLASNSWCELRCMDGYSFIISFTLCKLLSTLCKEDGQTVPDLTYNSAIIMISMVNYIL